MSERMRRGWELTKKSWSVVRSNTGLVRFPIYGGIAALIWMLPLGAGGAALLASAAPRRLPWDPGELSAGG